MDQRNKQMTSEEEILSVDNLRTVLGRIQMLEFCLRQGWISDDVIILGKAEKLILKLKEKIK